MKWFKHDSDAHLDSKIKKVLMRYKSDGYALYWYCLELIAGKLEKKNITFDLEHDAEILGYDLGIDTLRVEEIMRYMVQIGLFEINEETQRIMCLKLGTRIDESTAKNPEIRAFLNQAKLNGQIKHNGNQVVYVIKANGLYKIGRTGSLDKRFYDIKTVAPDAVIVHVIPSVDVSLLENILHKAFDSKIKNGEWFELNDHEVNTLCAIKDGDKIVQEGFLNVSGTLPNDSGTTPRVSGTELELELELELNKPLIRPASQASETDNCPHQEIIKLYHELLPNMTRIKTWTEKRKGYLRKLWREDKKRQNLDYWRRFFTYVSQSDFLCGRKNDWQADLEWLIKPANFVKIIEGKYENKAEEEHAGA